VPLLPPRPPSPPMSALSPYTPLFRSEEYALSLGFRLVSGDRLFATMWEPHQLSALTTAPLVALFLGVTGGTTGLLLFVRVVMLLDRKSTRLNSSHVSTSYAACCLNCT